MTTKPCTSPSTTRIVVWTLAIVAAVGLHQNWLAGHGFGWGF